MTREELEELFQEYLYRSVSEEEYRLHGNKKYSNFINEISNCQERQELLHSQKPSLETTGTRIALLVCGHIRKNNLLNSLINKAKNYNIDTFIFTWDNIGLKGKETKLDDEIKKEEILKEIKKYPNLRKYEIENNKFFIQSLGEPSNTYFNFSSPENFIKSQLYSVKKCYELFESYVKETGVNYSLVIKTRFDLEFTDFNLSKKILDDITKNKIIFVPNSNCNHTHPDNSTSCFACDKMYHKYNLKKVHVFEHSNIICDIFAYGSPSSMKDYCLLYDFYDTINESFIKDNLESLENNEVDYNFKDNVYHLNVNKSLANHLNSLYYINCSYPERLLQKHLQKYMLVESRIIRMSFKR